MAPFRSIPHITQLEYRISLITTVIISTRCLSISISDSSDTLRVCSPRLPLSLGGSSETSPFVPFLLLFSPLSPFPTRTTPRETHLVWRRGTIGHGGSEERQSGRNRRDRPGLHGARRREGREIRSSEETQTPKARLSLCLAGAARSPSVSAHTPFTIASTRRGYCSARRGHVMRCRANYKSVIEDSDRPEAVESELFSDCSPSRRAINRYRGSDRDIGGEREQGGASIDSWGRGRVPSPRSPRLPLCPPALLLVLRPPIQPLLRRQDGRE